MADDVKQLVQRAMSKSLEDRYASVEDFQTAIEALLPSHPWPREDADQWWKTYYHRNSKGAPRARP